MTPPLSIVVVAFHGARALTRCLEALERQAPESSAEVLVARAGGAGAWADLARRFPSVAFLDAPLGATVPQLRWLGMKAARGAVVALLEDDCVPAADWAKEVLRAHAGPHVAVGGAVEPGPYARAADWAVYLYEYGRFMLPFAARESAALPGNNVSYKASALVALSDPGPRGFVDTFVHRAWEREGRSMLLAPEVVVFQHGSWALPNLLVSPFHHGRAFAAERSKDWSQARRAAFALATPALPLLQLLRAGRHVARRTELRPLAARAAPWLVLFGASWAIGEGLGALTGPGQSAEAWR